MTVAATCPCGTPAFPLIPTNPPGQAAIGYRVADFVSLRHAMLHSLDGEVQLGGNWRPGADGDLAVQMIEWWAYLGDILSLYNERIAQQSYLRTADQAAALHALIALLGYRPRPGIGAQGIVAALISGGLPFTLPRGFKIQSKPGPGKPPQIFEVDADTPLGMPDQVPFDVPPFPGFVETDLTLNDRVLLRGPVTSVRRGTQVLFVPIGWTAQDTNWNVRTVVDAFPEKDPRGRINTRVLLSDPLTMFASASGYRMSWGAQTTYLWHYNETNPVTTTTIDLQSVTRQVHVGDLILLFDPLQPTAALLKVTSYAELVWFANADKDTPTNPPADKSKVPIPVLHSELGFTGALGSTDWNGVKAKAAVLYGWRDAGQLIAEPSRWFGGQATPVRAVRPATFPAPGAGGLPMLIEDVAGKGADRTRPCSTWPRRRTWPAL